MKLLKSKKFELSVIYFITDRNEIKDIPIGVPFIYGEDKDEEYIIRLLEYEILYQKAINSGFNFNFRQILHDEGYDLLDFGYAIPAFIDYKTYGIDYEPEVGKLKDNTRVKLTMDCPQFAQYIKDSSVYVDITKLKELKVFPTWMDTLEEAVSTNIHNFATFNSNMYNKKLGGMYGALEYTSPKKNLIIIDISGSIPKGVSSTCLTLSKNLAESFYADILITGSISTLYLYEELYKLDIDTIYEVNGMNNEQEYFKALVSNEEKHYKTCIAFGDNHHPGGPWQDCSTISDSDGRKLCKWKIDKLISFHTTSGYQIAGYARWFEPSEIKSITDWVKYLNK